MISPISARSSLRSSTWGHQRVQLLPRHHLQIILLLPAIPKSKGLFLKPHVRILLATALQQSLHACRIRLRIQQAQLPCSTSQTLSCLDWNSSGQTTVLRIHLGMGRAFSNCEICPDGLLFGLIEGPLSQGVQESLQLMNHQRRHAGTVKGSFSSNTSLWICGQSTTIPGGYNGSSKEPFVATPFYPTPGAPVR
jgi:hypothetical protein